MHRQLERIDVDRRRQRRRGAFVVTQLLQYVGERDLSRIVRLVRRNDSSQLVRRAACIAPFEIYLRQVPTGAVVAAVLRKGRLCDLKKRDCPFALSSLHQTAGIGHRRPELIEPGERHGKALTKVRVELLVERREIRLEHAFEDLVCRLPALVRLQHALDRRLAVVARDEIADERRLVVREHHLLGIRRVHETVVHTAHRHELLLAVRVEEGRRDVEAPTRSCPVLLVHGEAFGEPPRDSMIGRA